MTAKRLDMTGLPFWPRLLSREQAAAYVGVSPNTFDAEVKQGIWPAPIARGATGRRLTWDRVAIDRALDSELSPVSQYTADENDFEARRAAAKNQRAAQGRQPGKQATR